MDLARAGENLGDESAKELRRKDAVAEFAADFVHPLDGPVAMPL
jgi:hypothetical protein